jgi:hypothetical protein
MGIVAMAKHGYERCVADAVLAFDAWGAEAHLELVAVIPDPPPTPYWSIVAGKMVNRPPDYTQQYEWTAPPQRIDAQGVSITLRVAATPPAPDGLLHAGIGVWSPLASATTGVEVVAEKGQPAADSVTVTLKPWAGLVVDAVIDVWVGAFYGPGVTYRYRAVR